MALLSILLTVGVYSIARAVYRRWPKLYLSPIFITPTVLILWLEWGRIEYATYMEGAQWLSFLLGPATVALGVVMHRHAHLLRTFGREVVAGVCVGSGVSLLTTVLPARWLGVDAVTLNSLAPRSVTTPIAMEMAAIRGGDPVLAAAFVMMTALIGLAIGPLIIRSGWVRSSVGKGALMGMGAHGAGTARAFEFGQEEGAFSSVAMILAAGLTLVLLPLVSIH